MTPEELTTSLQWRYATKVFDTEKTIAPDTWSTLEESMILPHPSACSHGNSSPSPAKRQNKIYLSTHGISAK
jgi:hypothetical protein